MFATVSELLVDAICIVSVDDVFVFISPAGENIFGYRPDEMIGHDMKEFIHPDDLGKTGQVVHRIMNGEAQPHFENRYIRKDGEVVHIMWAASWSEDEQVRVAVARDVTPLKQAQALQAAIYSISDAVNILSDLNVLYERINQIAGTLFHADRFFVGVYNETDQTLYYPFFNYPSEAFFQIRSILEQIIKETILKNGQPAMFSANELNIKDSSLDEFWLMVPIRINQHTMGVLALSSTTRKTPFKEKDKNAFLFIANQVSVALERKEMLSRLARMAQYDQLTNLPNRALFNDRLHQSIVKAKRHQLCFGLLYIDLNEFKPVNDNFGHEVGDLLLQHVAVRLVHCVRESDTVARLGGDEFVVLLDDIHHPSEAELVGEKIITEISKPYVFFAGHVMHITASIGIAIFPDHATNSQALLQFADKRMYEMKYREKSGSI